MNWWTERNLTQAAFFWPALFAASASETARVTAQLMTLAADDAGATAPPEPVGATPNTIVLDLKTVRLRDYGTRGPLRSGVPTLICAPLALHSATVADLAPGHSLVGALQAAGVGRLFMADWRSATSDMAMLGIDDYLATLNVLVDHIGAPVDLIGVCQGGWMSLVYAARFPAKVRHLVVAGSPIDPAAQPSDFSNLATVTPLPVFEGFVNSGGGRVFGHAVASFWGASVPDSADVQCALQIGEADAPPNLDRLAAAFDAWNAWLIDLPGHYYLEVIEKLYKRSELAAGHFTALGQTIDLSRLTLPIFALAGENDRVAAPKQVTAVTRLVSTPAELLRAAVVPGGHLSLFMGKTTLATQWPQIVHWLKDDPAPVAATSVAA